MIQEKKFPNNPALITRQHGIFFKMNGVEV